MPTTNPVPSQDPSDLLFNAGKLDEVLNGTGNSFTDRLGNERRTVAGMNSDFDAQLADAESDLNVYRADAAASAAEALGYLQTIRATSYGAYAEDPATDPLGNPPTVGDEYFNTTSNLLKRWNGTTWQASDINTANLAATSGSSLVGYDGGTVQDVLDGAKSLQDYAALRAYAGRAKRVYITGLPVTVKPAGIAGTFQYDSTDTTSADNGGTIIVDAIGRRWKRDFHGRVNVKWFGAKGDGIADDTIPVQSAVNFCFSIKKSIIFFDDGTYNVSPAVWTSSSLHCILLTGSIKIVGESRDGAIIRTVKLDGTLPNGSGTSQYRGAFGVINSQLNAAIRLENITIDGGNQSTSKSFNPYHKAFNFQTGDLYPVKKFSVSNCCIKNFEGEGLYAPSSKVSECEVSYTLFDNCGGSMGNVAGKTKYLFCEFTRGSNCSIEISLNAADGYLLVDGCTFVNGVKNTGNVISGQNTYEPFTGTPEQLSARSGTRFIVRNSKFEFTRAWIESTGSAPYIISTIAPKCIGLVLIENNTFTNCTIGGSSYGAAMVRTREYNDNYIIAKNTFIRSDSFFGDNAIEVSSGSGTNNNLQIFDNICIAEYPSTVAVHLFSPTTTIPKKFSVARNRVGTKNNIVFTSTITTVDSVTLPVFKTYTFKIVMNIVNSVPTVVNIARFSGTEIAKLINETPAAGYHERYVNHTPTRYNPTELITFFAIQCSGDTSNTFSIELVDV